MARLGDICIQITDGSHNPPMGVEQSNYLMLSSKNIDDDYITLNDPRYLSQEDFEAENRRTNIKPNDLLITIVGTIGRVAIVPNSLTEFCVQRSVAVLKPKPEIVYNRFLMHYLQSMRPYLEQESRGVAQKGIYLKQLSNLSIILPPLDEQRKIAAVLDKVSDLIAKRRQQLDKLDEIVKSRFIEMFGVYPANPMGWEIGTIRDIVTEVRYGSSRPAVDGGKYPYLRMNNITYGGELDLSDTKRIDIPDNELDKCTVRRGDVLFNRTNSKELVGKTCVYDRDEMMVLAGFVIRIRVKDCILPEFLSAFLNTDFSKQMLLGMCKTAIGQANINAQELQNIGLYLPPVELQRRFIQFKKETDKSKYRQEKCIGFFQCLEKSIRQEWL